MIVDDQLESHVTKGLLAAASIRMIHDYQVSALRISAILLVTKKATLTAEGETMDGKEDHGVVSALSALLMEQRDSVIANVRSSVATYIKNKKPRECLELVLRYNAGEFYSRLPVAANARYAKALIAFVRKQSFEGYSVDSALTDPTSQVVADAFSSTIGKQADEISREMVPLLISSPRFAAALASALVATYSGPVPAMLNRKITATLTAKLSTVLSQTIDSATAATFKASIANFATTTLSSPISAKIAMLVVGSLTASLAPIIVKILGTAAFKAALIGKIKAIIVGAMLGAFIKIIGAKIGLSAAGSIAFILIPAVLAWIAYEVVHFPEMLAEKVSASIAVDMASNFSGTAHTLADTIVEHILVDGSGMLASTLLQESVIVQFIEESIREAS